MNALWPVEERVVGNIDAELAVVSAMLCEPKAVDSLADILTPADFADEFLGHVFGLIVREHSLGRSVNPVTLRPFLEGNEAFAELGGWAWLISLTETRLSLLAANESALQIVAFAQRRRLIEGLRETIQYAADLDQPVGAVIEAADRAIDAAKGGDDDSFEFSGAQCLDTVISGFDKPLGGVECSIIPSVDSLLGPMRPAHLVVGAGRPGMGKTATAISYALGAAQRGHGVLFFSLEMSAAELGERMAADLCLESRIPYAAIRDRTLTAEQQREVCRARDRIAGLPIQIVDRGGLSISQLRARVRRWSRRFEARGQKLELVVVDYMQLLRGDRPRMERIEVVSEASRTLKEIAKEHSLAVFALAQLSRAVEQRQDKRPMLSDLRESGQIEQDADAVLFFLRDEYYLRLTEPHPSDPKHAEWQRKLDEVVGRIEFICAKRRNGKTGSLIGEFLYTYQAVRG